MKKVLLSSDDRIRPDSTCTYFKYYFEKFLFPTNVDWVYPEKLKDIDKDKYDLFVKIDDGLVTNRWNPSLHPSMYYVIDTHIDYEWRRDLIKEGKFDVLCFAQKNALKMDWDCPNQYWVPLGCDPEQHYLGYYPKKYDVGFIGNFHSKFAEKRFDYCDILFRSFPNFYFGHRTFKEMTKKFAECRLVFNKSLNKDVNMRFFEATCSGSALLTDLDTEQDVKELGYLNGVHYIGYTDLQDMLNKVRYYLTHSDEREKIAERGRNLSQSRYSYLDSVGQMMGIYEKIGGLNV